MHNMPGRPVGSFSLRPGALMAAADTFEVVIEGVGGHGAMPHRCNDPVIVAAQIVTAFQTIASRNVDPLESVVVSTTQIIAGDTNNVIPQVARMIGTVRTLSAEVRDLTERRMGEICTHIGNAFGAKAVLNYERGYPVTINHGAQTEFAAKVAAEVAGAGNVDAETMPLMGAEDFSYMLEARPGAFIFIGQGDTANVHHPDYDFNDDIIPVGASYWARLAESAMPVA